MPAEPLTSFVAEAWFAIAAFSAAIRASKAAAVAGSRHRSTYAWSWSALAATISPPARPTSERAPASPTGTRAQVSPRSSERQLDNFASWYVLRMQAHGY